MILLLLIQYMWKLDFRFVHFIKRDAPSKYKD